MFNVHDFGKRNSIMAAIMSLLIFMIYHVSIIFKKIQVTSNC